MIHKRCVIISGPTAVGKSSFAHRVATAIGGEIINADMGQFYVPLTIGTAKPNWQKESIGHHLFDILDTPVSFSVTAFRKKTVETVTAIWQRNCVPIIVGGSSYYIAALFFPPLKQVVPIKKYDYPKNQNLWERLRAIDPERAKEIDSSDTYRLQRALDIWQSTGIRPSMFKPKYDPICPNFIFIWLERDRGDLYDRINNRVCQMVDAGWVEEACCLVDTGWESFLKQKKIIGYPEVISYCKNIIDKETLIQVIQQKTRNYAKRQNTFWRMLYKKLQKYSTNTNAIIAVINLTNETIDRYIKQLQSLINTNK